MSCYRHHAALVDLARGVITQPETRIAEAHAAACPRCAALLEREEQLTSALRALAGATRASVSADVARDLTSAFENLHGARAAAARTRRWAQRAAVAAGVAGVGVLAWILHLDRTTPAPDVTAPVRMGATQTVEARANAPANHPSEPIVSRVSPPVHPPRRMAAGRRTLPAFVPLPVARALPELESGQVFRVHLPVGALPAYGLDISPDATGDAVTADVLVGQDGQARAIRVITSGTAGSRQ